MTWIQLKVYINLAEVYICLSYQNCYKICSDALLVQRNWWLFKLNFWKINLIIVIYFLSLWEDVVGEKQVSKNVKWNYD